MPDIPEWLVPLVLVVVAICAPIVRRLLRPRPRPGQIWFAQVPFEDGTGSKDRPVLIVSVSRGTCVVARFTSQDKSARREFALVPVRLDHRKSWVNLRPAPLKRSALRRRAAAADPELLRWYLGLSGSPAA